MIYQATHLTSQQTKLPRTFSSLLRLAFGHFTLEKVNNRVRSGDLMRRIACCYIYCNMQWKATGIIERIQNAEEKQKDEQGRH